MRKRLTPAQMRVRLRWNLPLKIGFYALRSRLMQWRSPAVRFGYDYKLHSALGRREQLTMMLAARD